MSLDPKKQVGGVRPHVTKDPIVLLLYVLMRDHINTGVFEVFFEEMAAAEHEGGVLLTNPYLGQYAENIAERLRIESTGAADSSAVDQVIDHLCRNSQEGECERPDEHVLRVIARDDKGRRYTFFVPLDPTAVNDTARQMLKESKPYDTAFLPSAKDVMEALDPNCKDQGDGEVAVRLSPLEDALRWYADRSNYTAQNPPGSGSPIWRDAGEKARAALQQQEGSE